MNIKKMFLLLITLIIVYIIFQLIFQMVSHGHSVEYIVKSDVVKLKVKEVYTRNEKNEEDNYYFEITDSNQTFNFQIFDDLKKRNYVIKEIKYLKEDEYTCIYPIFKTKNQLTDILCMKDNIIYPYQSIKGKNDLIDKFKDSLKEYYEEDKYQNDLSNSLKKDGITIYRNNILDSHYLALETYKGIALFNKKDVYKKVDLFEKDQYKREIADFYENKYITADYNQEYTFNEFYIVDIKTSKQNKIISNKALSLDGYKMGSIEDKMYVYDSSNKEQYAVQLKNNKISKVGNVSSGIKVYENGTWEDYSSYDAYENKKTFHLYKINNSEFKQYERVDKIGNVLSGYYYFYELDDDKYHVYRSSVQNNKILTYLFDTTNIENIIYQDDFIYYIEKNKINYFDNLSNKTVLSNKELEFNKNIKFGMYIS